MQVLVYAGDMLHVIEHFGYIVTDDDDGALLVDLLQHLVHAASGSSRSRVPRYTSW